MRDGREEVRGTAGLAIPEQFSKSSAATIRYCEAHKEELVSGFMKAFQAAVGQAVSCQEQGKKGNVKYILFSHLYSSMFLRDYKIRIDLMDERFYNDMAQTVSYWDAGGIYRLFEDDIRTIRQEVEKKLYRIHEYEVDDIRYLYYPFYHQLARSFLQAVLETALPERTFLPDQARGEGPLIISFGEYMGKSEILLTWGIGEEGI